MILCPNESGALAIDGFELETMCSTVLNPYFPLYTVGKLYESDPVHIQGRQGDLTWAPEIAGWEFQMQFVLAGECNPDGDQFATPYIGIESNMNQFNTEFLFPIATNGGKRPAVLTMPSGEERHANVQIRPMQPGVVVEDHSGICSASAADGRCVYARYVIPMFIPDGLFVP